MKFSFRIILLLTILLSNCKSKHQGEKKPGLLSNLVNITDNEDKGIKEIIAFYGGQCEYGVEKKISSNGNNQTNFWMKFSRSHITDSVSIFTELASSNIAYMFFKNLKDETGSYDNIRTEILLADGHSLKDEFLMNELELVKKKIPTVLNVVNLLTERKFQELKTLLKFDSSFYNYDKNDMIKGIESAENDYGKAGVFKMYGFRFFRSNSGTIILRIEGIISRNGGNSAFVVDSDPDSQSNEIFYLNYKLE